MLTVLVGDGGDEFILASGVTGRKFQAAVDLVGKYILADNIGGGGGPALLETYFGALMERLVRWCYF